MDNPPGTENWAAVGDAIAERMRQLKMSKAGLARETGLSETTIRYIGRPETGHHKSALVAMAAALRWRHDHLVNVLRGQPEKNTPGKTATEASLERLLHVHLTPLNNEITRHLGFGHLRRGRHADHSVRRRARSRSSLASAGSFRPASLHTGAWAEPNPP